MTKYFYFIDAKGLEHGPVERSYFHHNTINPESWVWFEGLPQWVAAKTVRQLHNALSQQAPRSFSEAEQVPDLETKALDTPYFRSLRKGEKERYHPYEILPKKWMLESILLMLFCCFPAGVVGLIYSAQVAPLWKQKRYAASVRNANIAETWVKGGLFVTVILWLVYLLFYLMMPEFLSLANMVDFWTGY